MTRPLAAAYKSQSIALIDKLKLEPAEVVRLAVSQAAAYALAAEIDRPALHLMLDAAVDALGSVPANQERVC